MRYNIRMSIGANIQELWLKVKLLADAALGEWGLIMIVLLVALSSFGLGRLSATEASRSASAAISVGQAPLEAEPKGMAIGGPIVASRTGTVYYFPWCGGATSIKPENQVWFKSEDSAQTAGYRAAKNCKGLTSAGSQ